MSKIVSSNVTPFQEKLVQPLTKNLITVLQINLGRKCNQACFHCHVEASPKRTEELSPDVLSQLLQIIQQFPQIETIDLTGGAPEMNYGFRPLVEMSRKMGKKVLVRSNLTLYFEENFTDLPDYFAQHQVNVIASLPCYLENNVDRQRGKGVYHKSIEALQLLNDVGYGHHPQLPLDLVYNPSLPSSTNFSLTPQQEKLEKDYKAYLKDHFNIHFNRLYTITNLPVGRTKQYLNQQNLHFSYLQFLESHYNSNTTDYLMCRNELSIDYQGNIYDCDFNQMENRPAVTANGEKVTLSMLLKQGNLDLISEVQTANYCYACTAGCGSSCGGALTP